MFDAVAFASQNPARDPVHAKREARINREFDDYISSRAAQRESNRERLHAWQTTITTVAK